MPAFYTDLFGPLHWVSKHQHVTAASSAEAEIYATYECIRFLLDLVQLMVYNDNKACINWAKNCTSKGLHHIQMKENHVQENVASQFVRICHVEGKTNLADLFTKEMRDTAHFVCLRDTMLRPRLIV